MTHKHRRPRPRKAHPGKLRSETRSMLEHMRLNGTPQATESDAFEVLMMDCGMMPGGYCSQAGSEECDFDCPWGGGT